MKEVLTVQRKNCLPCSEKNRYRAAVKSAYRAQEILGEQVLCQLKAQLTH